MYDSQFGELIFRLKGLTTQLVILGNNRAKKESKAFFFIEFCSCFARLNRNTLSKERVAILDCSVCWTLTQVDYCWKHTSDK